MLLSKIPRKIARLAEFLENPKLFGLRRRGIPINTFFKLSEPWLTEANINTILDIGANVGQFAKLIHEILPTAVIYSFEPLEDCYGELKKRMRKVGNFEAFNMVIGDTNGELEFHRNEYSPSSSILPMTDLHRQNYPFTAKQHLTKVRMARLDEIAGDLNIEDNLLVKMDVRGVEDRVIAGARDILKRAEILILETSFQPLYVGQLLFEGIYDSLKENFIYMGDLAQNRSSME